MINQIFIVLALLFLWHIFIMISTNKIMEEEFSNNAPHLCNCGLDVYKNIYYVCSNNQLVNLLNNMMSGSEILGQGSIPREYDLYSFIFNPNIKWGIDICN